MRHIAVIDIGKTNAKLALVDLATLREIDVATRPNRVLAGPPWPHFDTEGIWQFLLAGLAGFQRKHGIDGISVTTHGACVALLDAAGSLAAPILDYEHDGPDTCAPAYDAIRPDFDETGSPGLPAGLNVGAQLFWQFRVNPGLRARVARIVTYPQYWAHRLTGIAAADVTSVGCHTDLWNPVARRPSRLVDRLAIAGKLAPVRRPRCWARCCRASPLRPACPRKPRWSAAFTTATPRSTRILSAARGRFRSCRPVPGWS